MLVRYILWKVVRLSAILSLIFSFSVLFTQILRLVDVVSSLPIGESLLLLSAWFFYLLVYFFPNASLLAFTYVFFELKESKKLLIVETFGLSKGKLVVKVFILMLPVLFSFFMSGFLIGREDVQFLRRYSVYKYYSKLIADVPEKTFYSLPEMSIYVEERKGDTAKGVFFSAKDMVIFAEAVKIEEGRLVFEKGTVLYQRENKSFVATFDNHTFNLQRIVGLDKKSNKKDLLAHTVNFLMLLFCVPLSLYISLNHIHHVSTLYYFLAFVSLMYQFALILVRNLF